MKKYLAGFLMLGMMFLGGIFVSPSKVEAGLTSVQSQTVLNLLSIFGASTATITAVQNALVSSGNTGGTTAPLVNSGTTGNTNTGTGTLVPACQNNAMFNNTNGHPCTNYIPQTGAGTSGGTSGGTLGGTGNTGGGNTTSCNPNNLTAVYPTITINGTQVPCYKSCTNIPAYYPPGPIWNYNTASLCTANPNLTPPLTPAPHTASLTVATPNGGEMYHGGDIIPIQWTTVGIPDTNMGIYINLDFYDTDGTIFASMPNIQFVNHSLNDGSEKVTLPTTLPDGMHWGSYFTVTVGAIDTGTGLPLAHDTSNAKFDIQP